MAGIDLTPLEQSALEAIARDPVFSTKDGALGRVPGGADVIQRQIASLSVVSRENTGVGFFTHLRPSDGAPPFPVTNVVLGNVVARIEGHDDPTVFLLLFIGDDGLITFLEGATTGIDTFATDLATATFRFV